MNLNSTTKAELKALSKEVFGPTSYWRNHLYGRTKTVPGSHTAENTKGVPVFLDTFEATINYMKLVQGFKAKLVEDMKNQAVKA